MADKTSPDESNFPIKLVDWLKSSTSIKCPPLLDRSKNTSEDELESLEAVLKKLENIIAERIHSIESELNVLSEFVVVKDRPKKRPPAEPDKESVPKIAQAEQKPAKKRHKTATNSSSTRSEGKLPPKEGDKPVISKTKSKSSRTSAKEDSLEKLWNAVDTYFQDIVEDDLLVLDDYSHIESSLLVVPPLGKHYSAQWAAKDLENDEMADDMYENEENGPADSYGPLTRRLLSAFVEEEFTSRYPLRPEPLHSSAANLLQSCQNYQTFEQRLKEELVSLGILNSQSTGPVKPADEVLEELVMKQNELKSVCEFNKKRLQHLKELAVKEMKKQEIRRQLEEVDNDIMKSLHVLQSTKQRRRHISDKDRDVAKRALEKRKQLLKSLESLK